VTLQTRLNGPVIFVFLRRADTVEKLKIKLPHLESELRDNLSFKDFYQFTFNYAKNPCQKGLDLDMAIMYWNIVMQGRFKFLNLWCRFLQVSSITVSSIDSEISWNYCIIFFF
jgi:hypothetical protein